MELRQYLSVLRSRWLLIIFTTLIALGVGFTVSESTPEYTARSTLYVGSRDTVGLEQIAAIDRQVLTFSKMIDSKRIAGNAIEDLDLDRDTDDVVRATNVEPEPATQLLYIEVTDSDPETAQALSNAMADAFVEDIQEIEPGDSEDTTPQLPANVYERAQLPSEPEPTDQIRTMLLATLFGLIAGGAIAFLLDYLDVSLRTAADVERRLELPVLGVIPALGPDAPFGGRAGARPERPKEP